MPEPIDRREFISAATALAMLGGAGITIGCGSDSGSSPTPPPPPPPTGAKLGSVADNHGHTATILGAQLDAGGSITLNIQGSSEHQHTVVVSATQVTSIKAGTRVVIPSSSDEGLLGVHSHNVTFN
jgi:hypothetical protein